jgi:3-oxoacyl-[acyl-carrier protein] reductase
MNIVSGKKALITGASRGIGRAITERFIYEGAEVWGLGTREPDDLGDRISRSGGKLHWICADLGNLDSIEKVIDDALADAGMFDILVNNAGIVKDSLSFMMDFEDFQKVLNVNLSAAFLVSRPVAKSMIGNKKGGSIINMSSVMGMHGNSGQANYASSKAGIIGLTKSFAQETANWRIRVNAIAPGFIASDMTRDMSEKVKTSMLDRIPLKRAGTPEDIAEVALFLASDSSTYITGQVIVVDGGMFM